MIQLLDQNTINKIAAGEVIERPASIVKELVENSIDAKSTAITVDIKDGGILSIRITDNGIGIEPLDIKNAFLRHSTSKIRTIDDLKSVSSLGFRGEALASIASISQVELITKTINNLTGIRYIIEGGVEKRIEEIGCPEGSTFVINNMFYNTPVRKNFLKSSSTEAGYISELINRLALGNPQISFKFINNNQVKLYTSGNGLLKDCIVTIYGKEIGKNLIDLDYSSNDFKIKGFISKPVISRANRNYENYYINGRYIKSKVIQKAIEDAYKSKLTIHQYPFTAFNIEILSDYIDVNVHPTKMDIRFNNEEKVYEEIYNAISRALNKTELIPVVTFNDNKERPIQTIRESIPEPFEINRISELHPVKEFVATDEVAPTDNQEGVQIDYKDEIFTSPENIIEHKIIGQLFTTYWIVELKDKYYIIDQHAAHERVLYDKIIKSLENKEIFSQILLQPIIIELSMQEKSRFDSHRLLFKELGFDIEDFGEDSIALRGAPFIFNKPINPKDFINILDKLDLEYKEEKYGILLDEIASMACKAAVKANDNMSILEYKELINQLLTLENPFNCPHGRPTIIAMTRYELEKKFKRIQ